MSWFTRFCNLFRSRKVKSRVEKLDLKSPAESILTLLTVVKEEGFSKYTIRKAMQSTVETYSQDVSQLMEWIDWMHATVDNRDYVPARWKSVKARVDTRVLDDYLSNDGHDIHPSEFINNYTSRLQGVCIYLTKNDPEEDVRRRYYIRQYTPILKDVFNLLSELYRVNTR